MEIDGFIHLYLIESKYPKINKKWREIRINNGYNIGIIVLDKNYTVSNDNIELLKIVIQCKEGETIYNILNDIKENEEGAFINSIWYNWDKIKHLFDD